MIHQCAIPVCLGFGHIDYICFIIVQIEQILGHP